MLQRIYTYVAAVSYYQYIITLYYYINILYIITVYYYNTDIANYMHDSFMTIMVVQLHRRVMFGTVQTQLCLCATYALQDWATCHTLL